MVEAQGVTNVLIGDELILRVDKVANGGFCVARHNGQAVFVRHSLPGELVKAEVTQINKKYLRASVIEVIEPSAHRVAPPCIYSSSCGGCDWQHAELSFQRELKSQVVIEQLAHLGNVEQVNNEPLSKFKVLALSEQETGLRWRTRNRYANLGGYSIGMRMPRSRSAVEIDDCLIADEDSTQLAKSALHLGSNEIATAVSSTGQSVLVDQRGGPWLDEIVEDRKWRIHAGSFWQVHKKAPEVFVRTVREMAQLAAGDSLLDLYSGAGLFAACLAKDVTSSGSIIAVESSIDAVRDARRSCSDLANLELVTADVSKWLRVNSATNKDRFKVVILDPPRTGAGEEVISAIADCARETIVYVACDPAALGRDTGYLAQHGWQLIELVGFDAFPNTSHVECIAKFTKH
jgi:tRNA/tmRNA/rRNA uracil-C5-methylase (TrmA/RlmC/RlmD family)